MARPPLGALEDRSLDGFQCESEVEIVKVTCTDELLDANIKIAVMMALPAF